MIILEKDGLKMEVCTELQASAFEKNGYVRVQGKVKAEEPKQAEAVAETPKRRGRKAAAKS